MQTDVPSNLPNDMGTLIAPIHIPERDVVIPSHYIASKHNGMENSVVCVDGVPIEENGEVLTIGMVPPEFRFAIGEVRNGKASLIGQEEFEKLHATWFLEYYVVHEVPAPSVHLRPIPTVLEFVKRKLGHAEDNAKYIPLGQFPGMVRPERDKPDSFYDPKTDKMVPANLVEVVDGGEDTDVESLKAELSRLRELLSNEVVDDRDDGEEEGVAESPIEVAAIPEDLVGMAKVNLIELAKTQCEEDGINKSWLHKANKDVLTHYLKTGEAPGIK